jgi:hypothetical protein
MSYSTELGLPTERHRLRCLVVVADETKRAFLAEAWAFFRPGFEVFTAPDCISAIAWLEPVRPHVVVLGASLDPRFVRKFLKALDDASTDEPYVVIAEDRPELQACLPPDSPVPLLELSAPLSLDAVINVGRAAASIMRGERVDTDVVVVLPVAPVTHQSSDTDATYLSSDTEMSG